MVAYGECRDPAGWQGAEHEAGWPGAGSWQSTVSSLLRALGREPRASGDAGYGTSRIRAEYYTIMFSRRPRSARLLTAALPLFAAAAVAVACSAGFPDRVPPGNWGGLHAGMVVSDTGADIEYDCAAGRISAPMYLDAHGDFDLPGLFIETGPGPTPANDSLIPKLPARYTGHTNGKTMTFTMTVLDGSVAPQTYTVTYGGNPNVQKCL